MMKIVALSLVAGWLLLGSACSTYNVHPEFGFTPSFTISPAADPASEAKEPGPEPGVDGMDQMDAYRKGAYKISTNFVFQSIDGGDFQLGHLKDSWDSAYRYELDFLFHFPMQGKHLEPLAGGYIFYEDRQWSQAFSGIDYDTIGFGIETGANFFVFEGGDKAKFNLGLLPYARGGFGFEGGTFDNIPQSVGYSTGNFNGQRVELTLGLDAFAMIAKRLRAALGFGFNFWSSSNVNAVTRELDGTIIDPNDYLSYRGTDIYVRVGLGFKF